jgi:methyltransferase
MNAVGFAVAVIFGLMLAENRVSRRHEHALRMAGALEPPGDVYRALAVAYPASFLLMGVEGIWRTAAAGGTGTAAAGPSWAASGVVLFAASKALKYWAIRTLGDRWSFRVLVQPGRPLVTSGPYRYLAHPNYVGVVGELAGAAMMVGARISGPLALAVFAVLLRIRIRFEERALGDARARRHDVTTSGT